MKTDDYTFEANVLSFTGNCKVKKQEYTFDGEIKTKTYITTYKITIDLEAESGGFFLDANPIDEIELPWFGDWDRQGDVLEYYPK